jgi:signal peptidase I
MTRKKTSAFGETVWTIIWAVVIALGVRTVAYEPFNIPSKSMVPTLLVGDYLFVSKFSYGYSRYSLPFSLPLLPERLFFTMPERGDVAVFKLPTDNKTDYIKRIIGLPGDSIQVRRGILHINGEPVKREKVADFISDDFNGFKRQITRFKETLPNGRVHYILEETDSAIMDNTDVYTVPPDHFFAMGDNRDNSRDSRYLNGVGFIPRENLVGRAEFMFFSINGEAWKFWQWLSTVRGKRLFQSIE